MAKYSITIKDPKTNELLSIREVATELGRPEQCMRRWLSKNNCKTMTDFRARDKLLNDNGGVAPKLKRTYLGWLSRRQICDLARLSNKVITERFRKYGSTSPAVFFPIVTDAERSELCAEFGVPEKTNKGSKYHKNKRTEEQEALNLSKIPSPGTWEKDNASKTKICANNTKTCSTMLNDGSRLFSSGYDGAVFY